MPLAMVGFRVGKALVFLLAFGLWQAGPGTAFAASADDVRRLIETGICPACDLSGAKLSGLKLKEADLQRANLSGADLRKSDLRRANLGHAILSGARLKEARLKGADLGNADLRRADLREADLRYSNLYGADLQSADLSNAEFEGAVLGRTNFAGARGLSEELAARPAWTPERQVAPPDYEPNPLVRFWRYVFGS